MAKQKLKPYIEKPRNLKSPAYLNPDSQPCVRKTFLLLSFLSQQKTTLLSTFSYSLAKWARAKLCPLPTK